MLAGRRGRRALGGVLMVLLGMHLAKGGGDALAWYGAQYPRRCSCSSPIFTELVRVPVDDAASARLAAPAAARLAVARAVHALRRGGASGPAGPPATSRSRWCWLQMLHGGAGECPLEHPALLRCRRAPRRARPRRPVAQRAARRRVAGRWLIAEAWARRCGWHPAARRSSSTSSRSCSMRHAADDHRRRAAAGGCVMRAPDVGRDDAASGTCFGHVGRQGQGRSQRRRSTGEGSPRGPPQVSTSTPGGDDACAEICGGRYIEISQRSDCRTRPVVVRTLLCSSARRGPG